jgi:hypothetical protein
MRAGEHRAAWLPTERQELLLRAGLEDGAGAAGAWDRWRAEGSLDRVDTADLQLLPLVARNISRLRPDDPDLGRLKGLYRFTWARNQLLLNLGADAIRELERSGIETLALKGAALSVLVYRDLGVRPMDDFDVLVRRDRAVDAIAVLRRRFAPQRAFPNPEERVPIHHSTAFSDGEERELDLHWYSLWYSSPDDDFWASAVPIEIGGARSLALCPTDQLLHVCAHGACWHPIPMLRWVADATTLLRVEEIDWERLVSRARDRQLTITISEAITYLRSALGVEVPVGILDRLRRSRPARGERAARHAATRPPTIAGALRYQWERYRRLKRLDPGAPRQSSFVAQLRATRGYDSYMGFSRHVVRRALGLRR